MLIKEYINIINAIRSYVNGEEIDGAFCSNLAYAYQICRKHNLVAIMADILDRTDVDKNDQVYRKFQMDKNQAIYKNVAMDIECEDIIAFLEENNIWYMLLKGLVIREYYPNPELREMSDNDILVDKKYMQDIHDFMIARGYSIKEYGITNHDEYLKKPAYNFEMHRALFDKDDHKKWNDYYENIFSKLIKKDPDRREYIFKDEDFYIYFMVHTYKHYTLGGMGLRTILDVYLYLRVQKDLDFSYINNQLEELGVSDFEQQFRKLSFHIFESKDSNWYESLNSEEQNMLKYVLGSGTYGNVDNLVANRMGHENGGRSKTAKLKYVFRRLFPRLKELYKYHPFVCKHKWITPFAYLYRIVRLPFKKGNIARAELKAVLKK